MGGVPSEKRFNTLTQGQWSVLLNHYFDKKQREREEIINAIEYLAMLVSFNPKAVSKVIAARKKQVKMAKDSEDNPDKYLTVNKEGQNEFGQHVNTTFFADLEKFGGKDALTAFENPKDYKVDEEKDESYDTEDEKFIAEAKKMFNEREKELLEEAKFREEHPELFQDDSIIF